MTAKTVKKPTTATAELREPYYSLPVSNLMGGRFRAACLHGDLALFHGLEEADKIFKQLTNKRTRQESQAWALLWRLDSMKKPEPFKLARLIVEEARRAGKAMEVGTVHKSIMRAIRRREKGLKAGTWRGPGGPERPIAGGVIRIEVVD